jgi:hypothetical protein
MPIDPTDVKFLRPALAAIYESLKELHQKSDEDRISLRALRKAAEVRDPEFAAAYSLYSADQVSQETLQKTFEKVQWFDSAIQLLLKSG